MAFLKIALIVPVTIFYFSWIVVLGLMIVVAEYIVYRTRYRDRVIIKIKSMWAEATFVLVAVFIREKITVVYSKNLAKKKKSLIVSNHINDYDWIVLIRIFYHFKKYENIRIIMKESLANVPFFGKGMKLFGYIFLKRSMKDDRVTLEKGMEDLKTSDDFSLLLFPEGTYIGKNTHESSKEFSLKRKICVKQTPVVLEELLIPRTGGYKLITESIGDNMESIIDVTLLINPYVKYQEESFRHKEVFLGSRKILNYICVLETCDVVNFDFKTEEFLYELFLKKDKFIQRYKNVSKSDEKMNSKEIKKFCEDNVEGDSSIIIEEMGFMTKKSIFYILSCIVFYTILITSITIKIRNRRIGIFEANNVVPGVSNEKNVT